MICDCDISSYVVLGVCIVIPVLLYLGDRIRKRKQMELWR
jgi:hypothetical protein